MEKSGANSKKGASIGSKIDVIFTMRKNMWKIILTVKEELVENMMKWRKKKTR